MVKKVAKAVTNKALEPLDLHGNWKVEKLTFVKPIVRFGLKKGTSTFKIENKGSRHVLIKKKNVGWNGSETEIALTEITSSDEDEGAFNANFRLKAPFTFNGDEYEVFLGSDTNGKSLKIEVEGDGIQGHPGGTSTAGRGG